MPCIFLHVKCKHTFYNIYVCCRSSPGPVMLSTLNYASSLSALSDCIISLGEITLGYAECPVIYARIFYGWLLPSFSNIRIEMLNASCSINKPFTA